MSKAFSIVQGDRLPKLHAVLQDEEGVIDLTDVPGVTFNYQTTSVGAQGGFSRTVECDVIAPTSGIVEYQWADGDTDVPGSYNGRFAVDFGDKTESFPNDGWITFEILPVIPAAVTEITKVDELIEPVRALLQDTDDTIRKYEDESIRRMTRTMIRAGKLSGYTLTTDRTGITPVISEPRKFGELMYQVAKGFITPDMGGYSFRTRALSESFGETRSTYLALEHELYDLKNGGAMFTCFTSFYSWLAGISGVEWWTYLTEIKLRSPVATVTVGRDGVQVQQ